MELHEVYKEVRKSIVAFVPKYLPLPAPDAPLPDFPPIIGTGFIIDDGLIATNDHVIELLVKLPRPEAAKNEWPFCALLLHEIPDKGIAEVPISVLGVFKMDELKVEGYHYGPPRPDFGLVHVKMKGLPRIQGSAFRRRSHNV